MSALLWPGALWLLVAAIAITLIVSLKRLDKRAPKPMRARGSHLDEWHHGWIGLVCIGVLAALTLPTWAVVGVFGGALLIALDDAAQHAVQAFSNPRYRSPLWHAYRWFLNLLP